MPFYQLLCISVHYKEYQHIKQLVSLSATHLFNKGAVIRNLHSWGTLSLPQRMHRHGSFHSIGDYWSLHFDASPRSVHSLNALLRRDPRVIRWSILKLAHNIPNIANHHAVTVDRSL